LHQPWHATDSGEGIAWGVLASPSIRTLLRLVKEQQVEDAIGYPRYLIGATGLGSNALRHERGDPLPLSELIFLHEDADIRTWLLANQGKAPLDLLVLESRQDQAEKRDETPAPASGRYPFFDRKVWEHWGRMDTSGGEKDYTDEAHDDTTSSNHEESNGDDSGTQDEVEISRARQSPEPGRGDVITLVSFCVQIHLYIHTL
jgi:hypothetical protein